MYPAYVPGVLYAIAKNPPFGYGLMYHLAHPDLRWQVDIVEQAIHETAHAALLWRDDELEWRDRTADISALQSSEIRDELNQRNDRPRQEAMALAIQYWIMSHWGFTGLDDWLQGVVELQPAQVTVRRVMHHLKHPVKRRYILTQAHRTMKMIRQSVQNWRAYERGKNQGT